MKLKLKRKVQSTFRPPVGNVKSCQGITDQSARRISRQKFDTEIWLEIWKTHESINQKLMFDFIYHLFDPRNNGDHHHVPENHYCRSPFCAYAPAELKKLRRERPAAEERPIKRQKIAPVFSFNTYIAGHKTVSARSPDTNTEEEAAVNAFLKDFNTKVIKLSLDNKLLPHVLAKC